MLIQGNVVFKFVGLLLVVRGIIPCASQFYRVPISVVFSGPLFFVSFSFPDYPYYENFCKSANASISTMICKCKNDVTVKKPIIRSRKPTTSLPIKPLRFISSIYFTGVLICILFVFKKQVITLYKQRFINKTNPGPEPNGDDQNRITDQEPTGNGDGY